MTVEKVGTYTAVESPLSFVVSLKNNHIGKKKNPEI